MKGEVSMKSDISETGFEIGADLYGVSVEQLKARLIHLHAEIDRINNELMKKEKDISAAHELFGS